MRAYQVESADELAEGESVTLEAEIAQVVDSSAAEITKPHLGHFNAFPLERAPEHRRGGALDWARGADLSASTVTRRRR